MKLPFSPGPVPVPLWQLLGVRNGDDPELWGRLRATQLFVGRRLALFLLAANLSGAVAVSILFNGRVPHWWLATWFVGLVAVSTLITLRRLNTRHLAEGQASLQEMRDTALEGLALAAIWSFPPLVFAATAPAATFDLWMILSVLMTAAAFAMAPLVLAALSFIGGVAASAILLLLLQQAIIPALATLIFAALLVAACITRARFHVMLRAIELNLSDSNETVSLLLGEFEDSRADWLWETDAQRRLCRVSTRVASALGYTPDQLEGMSLLQALAGPSWDTGDFSPGLRLLADKLKRREPFRDLVLPVIVGGKQHWWEITASPRHDERGRFVGFRGVGSDVTEQRTSADKINRLARFDALTGLPNRLYVNEALARALAEETRLIGPIGEWVVRTACEEATRWPDDVRVAINVSPEQLHNPNFVAVVARTLASTKLAPHRLELEVTESVFMREGTGAVKVLDRILELGVRLSLDDFGTGYSSLGYLSRTRFSSIKIDRSFVTAAAKGVPEALAIIRAVVALAGSLGMATTAEGVETSDELTLVRALGVSKIQGFYFGRPLPVSEARALAGRTGPAFRAA